MTMRAGIAGGIACLVLASACGGEEPCGQAAGRIDSDCAGDPYGDVFGTTRALFVSSCGGADGTSCAECVNEALDAPAGGTCAERLDACRAACASADAGEADGGMIDGGMIDAGMIDGDIIDGDMIDAPRTDGAASACDPTMAGVALGSRCVDSQCAEPLACREEETIVFPSVTPSGAPGPDLSATTDPGGACTVTCPLNFDNCGECGACSTLRIGRIGFFAGSDVAGNALGVCRPYCTPSRTDNGGCLDGYTCDLLTGTCVEACANDTQCQFVQEDLDGDFVVETVFVGPGSGAYCDPATGRCEVRGNDSARPGDPCAEDIDCEDNGLCIVGDAWPGGYCTRLGCEFEAFPCVAGAVCDVRSQGIPACLDGCRIAAEPIDDVLGTDGNGAGCAEGFMCSWDGASAATDDPNGACIPGAYNAVTTPNLAQACQSDDDCYSPYGYASCIPSAVLPSGMCSLTNCAQYPMGGSMVSGILPGIPAAVPFCDLDAGEICVNFGTAEVPSSVCLKSCTSASACAPSYACPSLFADGTRACWPFCGTMADCRVGQQCLDAGGLACDLDPGGVPQEECFCVPHCFTDADCAGAAPEMETCIGGRCQDCDPADDSGCDASSARPQCDQFSFSCRLCDQTNDDGCSGPTPQCIAAGDVCAQCASNFDCPPATRVCAPSGTCVQCVTTPDCVGTPATPVCDLATNTCIPLP